MEETNHIAVTLIVLGTLFLFGLLTDTVGRRTRLPRVTLLMVFGFLMGPEVLGFLTEQTREWFPLVSGMTLTLVGFLLGEKFSLDTLREHGIPVMWISIGVVLFTGGAVFGGLTVLGFPLLITLLLAGVAPATAPAATMDVVHEAGAKGPFASTLLGIVAVDDAWGLILFSVIISIAQYLVGFSEGAGLFLSAAWEIAGAMALGVMLGIPMAYLTGRIRPGEPTLVEALGIVFLCGGIAQWLEVSYLLASMTLGSVVANRARHHTRPFHAIEDIEWPLMIIFFVLAGASLHPEALARIGLLGAAYIVFRIIGRVLGAYVGSVLSHADSNFRRWMGVALMPQAGIATGMALIAAQRFPEMAEIILPVTIGATVVFELIGPPLTRLSLSRAGELET